MKWPQPPVSPLIHCPIDFDHSGFVDFEDFDTFVRAFEVASPASDFNNDGFVTADDFDDFISAFNAGCGPLPDGPLFPGRVWTTTSYASCVAIADVDGDGLPDLVIADQESNTVGVLLNLGSGVFADKVDLVPGSTRPTFVAVGDLDGDGHPDVATANSGTWTFSLYRNVSSAGKVLFSDRLDYATPNSPSPIAIGDMNADGKPDIATANGDSSVSVFRNTTVGRMISFDRRSDHAFGRKPNSIVIADLTGDDVADVAVSSWDRESVSVFQDTIVGGVITLSPPVTLQMGGRPSCLAVADFDGDGRRDLAVANSSSGSTGNRISILRSLGNGAFAPKTDLVAGVGPSCVSVGDVNGDGRVDLVATNTEDESVGVYINAASNGQLAFATKQDCVARSSPKWVAIGDLDGDGHPELAIASIYRYTPADGGVSILQNAGDGTFVARVSYPVGFGSNAIALGDFDGDGKEDVAVAKFAAGTVSLLRNLGDGRYADKVDVSVGAQLSAVSTVDVDGDGRIDLAVTDRTNNRVSVFRNASNRGQIAFDSRVDCQVGVGPNAIAVGDMNGDGRLDLAVTCGVADCVSVLLNADGGTFTNRVDYAVGDRPTSAVICDLDKDGHHDLAIGNYGSRSLTILRNTGNGTLTARADVETVSAPLDLSAADLDGDGRVDLLFGSLTNSVGILRNVSDPGEIALAPRFVVSPPSSGSLVVGDFNDDGHSDFVVANTRELSMRLFENRSVPGELAFKAPAAFDIGSSPESARCGDLNDDGALDLAMICSSYNGPLMTVLLNQHRKISPSPSAQANPDAASIHAASR